ncbi:BsuPI-related putative proteinase inhibitor [Halopiger goleimassiliensis]|uniref:BsuPI-related putative proteinase inhibitor n=1 Tax=Halopiger goleimassiliensis TaxID=1293048 RepID=UPI000677F935|nr:BsuPI-related putative proteinase inhibitor [Halopiger goleimassiliensis]
MALEGTLEASVSTTGTGSTTVEFAFTVTNDGSDTVDLQFSDAAKAEFVVQDEGREIWRYTDGRMFAQMLSTDRLEPGESTTYDAEWTDPRPGRYTAVAELRAQEATCEARTDLTIED